MEHHDPQTITVTIISPRGTKEFVFEKTAKVQEVIDKARVAFGFEPGAFVLRREATNETLDPQRPLVSYHLEPKERLVLVPEMGSGV